jgi:hypothetical protein
MTPRELLALEPKSTSHNVYQVLSEIPEADDTWNIEPETDERMEWRRYAYVDFDGRRIWELGSIWFDGKPTVIVQRAGREGRDHHERFIVDSDVYWDLVKYSYSLPRSEDFPVQEDARGMDEDMGDELTSFYGRTFEEMRNYERSKR